MILAFGTYDTARHPRAGILVDGLRARGAHVVEANRPLGFSTAERVRMLRQPWRLPTLALRLARCWAALARDARAVRREHGEPEVVLVGYLGHFDVLLARALFRHATVVLDHLVFAGDTAADRGARGLRVRLLGLLDRAALACADVAVVDTDEHAALLPDPGRGVVVPVGATARWFAAGDRAAVRSTARSLAPEAAADAAEPDAATTAAGGSADPGPTGPAPVSVVFFGLFTPLQGAPLIARALTTVLRERPQVRVSMIGSGQDWDAARAELAAATGGAGGPDGTGGTGDAPSSRPTDAPAVTWTAWVDPDDLPDLVAAHDVCLGIFADTPKALRVVPNKVYEGLAAGCAVVTSDTPPQRRVLGDLAVLVPPADAEALARALVDLVDDPDRLRRAREAAHDGARRFAAAAVVGPLAARLGLDEPPRDVAGAATEPGSAHRTGRAHRTDASDGPDAVGPTTAAPGGASRRSVPGEPA